MPKVGFVLVGGFLGAGKTTTIARLTAEARLRMSHVAAFAAEVIGTAILLLVIFCVTDE
jgi:G3E family GTPase